MPFDAPVIRAVLFVSLSSTPNLQNANQIYKSKQFAYQEIGQLLEGCEKVQQVVAQQIDVVAHGAVGPLRIMGQDRLHDRLVLAHGIGDPVRHPRHPTAMGRYLVAQLSRLISQKGIARGFIDRLMELLIDVVKHVDIAGFAGRNKLLMNLRYFVSPGLRHAPCGEPRAEPLELGHHLEHLDQRLRLDGAHGRALAPAQLDQIVGGHQPERLPHRGPRDAEALRDLLFIEPAAGLEVTGCDRPFELLAQALRQRHARYLGKGTLPVFGALAYIRYTQHRHNVSPICIWVYNTAHLIPIRSPNSPEDGSDSPRVNAKARQISCPICRKQLWHTSC